jgi:hypothetical protein
MPDLKEFPMRVHNDLTFTAATDETDLDLVTIDLAK